MLNWFRRPSNRDNIVSNTFQIEEELDHASTLYQMISILMTSN